MGFLDRLKDDMVFMRGALRTLKMTTPIANNPTRVFPDVIEEAAQQFGDAPALLSDHERFSYRALSERSNRYARWALDQGLNKGDTVCLMMPNRPEYVAVWLGITRAGGVVSLLNINLVGSSLAHCIDIVSPKHLIVATQLLDTFNTARPMLKGRPTIWTHGEGNHDFPRIDQAIDNLPGSRLEASERRPLTIEDRALYIYTSGTTGLPKAANINHYRLMLASHGFAGVMNTQASDRTYVCLAMYHTVGGVVAPGALLIRGGSCFIREKFSAREFWDDVVRNECTVFQYIGELCRYLVNTPSHPLETKHRLRIACGNGLRPDVWNEFKDRFRIPQILEFYAATEGNVSLFNFSGKPGSVGRIPWFLAKRFPTVIVKFDIETEQPLRNAEGLCIPCKANEAGEVIGKILKDPTKPGSRFEGYAEESATEKKILRDVFEKGDAWFRTGDIMRQDESGYFYFIDRVGDTFRWKAENVSTFEVAEVMTVFPGILEAVVYGVRIAGKDGRAGMAALRLEGQLDLKAFRDYLVKHLPEYARPLFLRIDEQIEITSTFKQRKVNLVEQGFDPSKTSARLYFNDPERNVFEPLDAALYQRIQSGQIRF
jgi:fatty-acyl-CoA synthase